MTEYTMVCHLSGDPVPEALGVHLGGRVPRLAASGREAFPMDMRIPPLKIKIMRESNPLKSRISVRRLAVHRLAAFGGERVRQEVRRCKSRPSALRTSFPYVALALFVVFDPLQRHSDLVS